MRKIVGDDGNFSGECCVNEPPCQMLSKIVKEVHQSSMKLIHYEVQRWERNSCFNHQICLKLLNQTDKVEQISFQVLLKFFCHTNGKKISVLELYDVF